MHLLVAIVNGAAVLDARRADVVAPAPPLDDGHDAVRAFAVSELLPDTAPPAFFPAGSTRFRPRCAAVQLRRASRSCRACFTDATSKPNFSGGGLDAFRARRHEHRARGGVEREPDLVADAAARRAASVSTSIAASVPTIAGQTKTWRWPRFTFCPAA